MATQGPLKLETTALYEIRVQGSLDNSWFDRLGDADIRIEHPAVGAPVTVLTCVFIDQAALSGALNLLYDLGFPLLSVQCMADSSKG